jgi:hypothetical protein
MRLFFVCSLQVEHSSLHAHSNASLHLVMVLNKRTGLYKVPAHHLHGTQPVGVTIRFTS